MGNFFNYSVFRKTRRTSYPTIPRIENKDLKQINEVWQIVEKDGAYYGFAMCTTIFQNHPQFRKYFEAETIPVFVQEAKVKKKFTMVCDLVSILFLHYDRKTTQSHNLLAYIAMMHKDMGLTFEDFENFMSDITAALVVELPHIMNEERVLIQTKCFKMLNVVLFDLMDILDKEMNEILATNTRTKTCCPWKSDPELQVMYGYPLKYWLYKKRHWEYRRALWASIEANTINSIANKEVKMGVLRSQRETLENARINRKRFVRTHTGVKNAGNNSDTTSAYPSEDSMRFKRLKKVSKILNKNVKNDSTVGNSQKLWITEIADKTTHESSGPDVDSVPNKTNDEQNNDKESRISMQGVTKLKSSDLVDKVDKVEKKTARERKRMRNLNHTS